MGFFVRGRLNRGFSRAVSRRVGPHRITPPPLEAVLDRARSITDLVTLLEARSNEERADATLRALLARGAPAVVHRFASFEGRGQNVTVEVGTGDRVLVLIAHHDAVPGSPGANDNAAAVAILLALLERLPAVVPPGLRVRLLFTGEEERGYLGARAYVSEMPLGGVVGVLSLELCGIGDSLALWDATVETPFLASVRRAFEARGLVPDGSYHQVGRIPIFGSDHRAFAAAGLPAYGLSVMPVAHADALRRLVLSPVRSVLMSLVHRPPPFDTYHTPRDAAATLDPAALALCADALLAVVAEQG